MKEPKEYKRVPVENCKKYLKIGKWVRTNADGNHLILPGRYNFDILSGEVTHIESDEYFLVKSNHRKIWTVRFDNEEAWIEIYDKKLEPKKKKSDKAFIEWFYQYPLGHKNHELAVRRDVIKTLEEFKNALINKLK